jgi:beta-glucosidase
VVADVLFGRTNPSGKSPVTWPSGTKQAAFATRRQYPGVHEHTGTCGGKGDHPKGCPQQLVVRYSEGLSMGYRWYEQHHVKPAFAFGHGLSYTHFKYGNLKVNRQGGGNGHTRLVVTYTVTNTGKRAGKEASQVYLSLPPAAHEPAKRLVGFSKNRIAPGKIKNVRVVIDSGAASHPLDYFQPASKKLSKWAEGQWKRAGGRYTVHVGGGSDNTPLNASVQLK